MALPPQRQQILTTKSDEYIASMEQLGRGIDYDNLKTDLLLILEAINNWSGRVLAEGGDIRFTYGCDDPCCATEHEINELVRRMHTSQAVLYPVSGFSLSDQDALRFGYLAASYRMTPHASGSRSDGIGIVQAKHIRDVEAAMQLWGLCASEDCMAYLYHNLDIHGLDLDDDERVAVRQIVISALQDRFSIGQIWNAMWRSVKDAAALSKRRYYNNAKAAKTIPKKLDKILTNSGGQSSLDSFERLNELPPGAVLTLFNSRFGIYDLTSGADARAKLVKDAALTPADELSTDSDGGQGLTRVTMYFRHQFTELDQIVLSCVQDFGHKSEEPEWDEDHSLGRLDYSVQSLYSFDGVGFINKLLHLLGVSPPSDKELGRHAAAAKEHNKLHRGYADESGWVWAVSEKMVLGGLSVIAASRLSNISRYDTGIDRTVEMVRCIPLPSGLCGVRSRYAYVYADFLETFDQLQTDGLTLQIPEENLEPLGCDRDIITAVANQDMDHLAELVASSIFFNLVSCEDGTQKAAILTLVANKLLDQTRPMLASSEDFAPDHS